MINILDVAVPTVEDKNMFEKITSSPIAIACIVLGVFILFLLIVVLSKKGRKN